MASNYFMPDGTDFDDYFELAQSGRPTGRDGIVNYFLDDNEVSTGSTVSTVGDFLLANGASILDRYISAYETTNNPSLTFASMDFYCEVEGRKKDSEADTTDEEYTGSGYVDLGVLFLSKGSGPPQQDPIPTWGSSEINFNKVIFGTNSSENHTLIMNRDVATGKPILDMTVVSTDVERLQGTGSLNINSTTISSNGNLSVAITLNSFADGNTTFDVTVAVRARNDTGNSATQYRVYRVGYEYTSDGGGMGGT
jgi:hypothetical protein